MHLAISISIVPFPLFVQNHVRDVAAFAIRGVPTSTCNSIAASIDIGILSIDALLSTIVVNSSAVIL
jgi:hypothetical protein